MEYNATAKMMLGYMDDDDDEILDYDGNLDLSTEKEDEDEAESYLEYPQQYPETPEEKINWQEQIRMIHLRSHLNQLMEKVKHAQYLTDKTREELKKCRGQIQQYEGERDRLFTEIQTKESDGNQSAIHRVRAAHERVCKELEAEQKLEKMIIDRLDQAEYELALAEVEKGKFILAEDDLLQREHQLSKEKTDMAMVRLHKEEVLARQAMITRRKDERTRRNCLIDVERRHFQAVEEAERSHERASKYLNKTLTKMKQRQQEEEDRYKTDMTNKMEMLLKLKNDITHNRENLRAIRARDKAAERQEKMAEQQERERILAEGGNSEETLLIKKRKNDVEKQKQQFEDGQKMKKANIMQKILREEENLKKRKQLQPYLWDTPDREKSLRVAPLKQKPLKALENYIGADGQVDMDGWLLDNKEKEILLRNVKDEVESSVSYMDSPDYKSMLRKLSQEVRGLPLDTSATPIARMSFTESKKTKSQLDGKHKPDKSKNNPMEESDETTSRSVPHAPPNSRIRGKSTEEEDLRSELDVLDDVLKDTGEDDEAEDESKLDALEGLEAEDEGSDPLKDISTADKESDSSEAEEEEEPPLDLARPEFEGLWDKETKPYKVPKDSELIASKPVGGSKMDQEILKRTMDKTREGIVITQVAAGREFTGCPFYSKPDVIHFKDFVVGKTYKKKVVLTNVSYTVNYIKLLDITETFKDFIKIHFDPPGQMSAGLTCEMIVTFKPMINEDLRGEVSFLTQTGPFQIPLICSTKKCDLTLDTSSVDFGTTVIGESLKRSFTLTNRGALGTKFDFFKVTGMKPQTLTTAGTSLGRLTTESMQAVSPDSEGQDKPKPDGSATLTTVEGKKKSEEALDKIPEAGESGALTDAGSGEEANEEAGENAEEATGDGSDQKQDGETEGATSPDLAVSEMEDFGSLDGMRVGPLATGEIGPFCSVRLEIIWQPTIPGKVDSEFLVSFADPLSVPLSIHALANAIDVPVWVERQTVDLKICMFDRLYQDTIIVNNRATTALRLKFEVCKELRNHLELLPKTGYIQAQSQFSAQLKFLPRKNLFEEAGKFFDPETGVLEAPMIIRVADQVTPVNFTVQAVVTTSDLEFDVCDIDFGHCTIHESVRKTITLTNKSILPQEFGFVGLPDHMEVQPNDGFGTLLPLETLELDVIFSPKKTKEYKMDLICRSLINRDFKIPCQGVGVLTPLELSHQVIHFSATPLYDVASTAIHVINNHTSSNEFTHPVPRIGKGDIVPVGPTSFEFVVPRDAPITVSPSVGTVEPGKKCRVQIRFTPNLSDYDIRQEAQRIHNKMAAAREEREKEEEARREREEKESVVSQGNLSTPSKRRQSDVEDRKKKEKEKKKSGSPKNKSKNKSGNNTNVEDSNNNIEQNIIRKPGLAQSSTDCRSPMAKQKNSNARSHRSNPTSAEKLNLNQDSDSRSSSGNSNFSRAFSKVEAEQTTNKDTKHFQKRHDECVPDAMKRRGRTSKRGNHERVVHFDEKSNREYAVDDPPVYGNWPGKGSNISGNAKISNISNLRGLIEQSKEDVVADFGSGTSFVTEVCYPELCHRKDQEFGEPALDRNADTEQHCKETKCDSVEDVNNNRNNDDEDDIEKLSLISSQKFGQKPPKNLQSFGKEKADEDNTSDMAKAAYGSVADQRSVTKESVTTKKSDELKVGSDMLSIDNSGKQSSTKEGKTEEVDEAEDNQGGKGKSKGKASPKTSVSQSKTSKLSGQQSSTGSAAQEPQEEQFDVDKLSRDSPEYLAAVTSLMRQYKGQFQSYMLPCYVTSGKTGNPGELKYSIHNTLYLEVHCPVIRPPVVVISDGGRRTVDFGDVSIGQTCPRSVTIQNISDKDLELTSSVLNPSGPFLMLNALRALSPGATHTVLLTFSPAQGQIFQEELGIKTLHSTLHLTLKGCGVSPLVNLDIEEGLFDLNAVLVGEYMEKPFTIENTSTLAIEYVIKQDSLSPLRYNKAQNIPPFLGVEEPHKTRNYVGTQNTSGKNVFDIVPTKGVIKAGETKEILVTFAPDHESDLYSDGVRLELFDQEENHFFRMIGQAKSRVMFLEGVDPLASTIESLAYEPAHTEEEEAGVPAKEGQGKKKGAVVMAPPALVTIKSVMKGDAFEPAVREIYAGCVRTMAISQKKNGEFSVEGLQTLQQKGFTVEPQRGMVEAGTKKPIVFTWTPPQEYDPSITIEETVTVSLRCDVTEQITLMVRAMVVSE